MICTEQFRVDKKHEQKIIVHLNSKKMETKLLNTGIADLLVVPDVPEGADNIEIVKGLYLPLGTHFLEWWLPDTNGVVSDGGSVELPEGYKYTVLGRASELTEEQWEYLVSRVDDGLFIQGAAFENYHDDETFFETATESGHSLLEANGILLVNPYGPDEPKDIPDLGAFTQARREKWKMWKEAQSKITNPLILKAEKI